jgi:hypothetical protein
MKLLTLDQKDECDITLICALSIVRIFSTSVFMVAGSSTYFVLLSVCMYVSVSVMDGNIFGVCI